MAIQIIPNFRKPHQGILQEPDKKLREVSKKVNSIDSKVKEVNVKLTTVLKEVDRPYLLWLGMASPQLGYNLRIIAIKRSFHEYQIMINPEVLEQKWVFPAISGCYSLKGLYLIQSPYWSKVKFVDEKSKIHIEIFKGGMSMLIQQEINHINGKLICD